MFRASRTHQFRQKRWGLSHPTINSGICPTPPWMQIWSRPAGRGGPVFDEPEKIGRYLPGQSVPTQNPVSNGFRRWWALPCKTVEHVALVCTHPVIFNPVVLVPGIGIDLANGNCSAQVHQQGTIATVLKEERLTGRVLLGLSTPINQYAWVGSGRACRS